MCPGKYVSIYINLCVGRWLVVGLPYISPLVIHETLKKYKNMIYSKIKFDMIFFLR